MKRHLSVLMLAARGTVYKFLGLLLMMAAAEGAMFTLALKRDWAENPAGLETLLMRSRVAWACAVCFLLLTALLCRSGCESGSRQGYTLRRLRVSGRAVFFWQSTYNTICFFIFWAAQLFIVLALCALYTLKADPASLTDQTVFLAFYRSGFLHSLLPLEEVSRYVRNVLLVLCLGVSAAAFPFRQRQNKIGGEVIALASLMLVFFSRDMGGFASDILISLLSLSAALEAASVVFRKEPEHEA